MLSPGRQLEDLVNAVTYLTTREDVDAIGTFGTGCTGGGNAVLLASVDSRGMKFGLLLPHFGEHASRDILLRGSQRAEEVGFDSVWVRTIWSSSHTVRWRSPTVTSTTP